MREGRTQALGMTLGAGREASFGGDVFARQCESLTTRFLGATALWTSSSSSLCARAFFAPSDRSGLRSADFVGVWAGFQLGLSARGFVAGCCDLGGAVAGS